MHVFQKRATSGPGCAARRGLTIGWTVAWILLVRFAVAGGPAAVEAPVQPPPRQAVLLPESVKLEGPEAYQRLLLEKLEGSTAVGPVAEPIAWRTSDPGVVVVRDGVVLPTGNGEAVVSAHVGSQAFSTSVQVQGMQKAAQWEFRRHVLPVLTKAGCNSGACHGALAGKGGFKLSLRGYDPFGDHSAITRDARGRRIELHDPGRSMILAKPTGLLPHKGGLRLKPQSRDYRIVSQWITDGAPPPTAEDPRLERLEVLPRAVRLEVGGKQPLLVRAHYSDGRVEDVTAWAKYSSANETVAQVDTDGLVQVTGSGEGAVVVWFSSQIVLARVTSPFPYEIAEDVYHQAPQRNFIDRLVLEKLRDLNLAPSGRSSDTEFLRRVYLDTIGRLPSEDDVRRFLADDATDKRDRVIDELLARDEFVDYWTYKWCDLLLVSGRQLRPQAVEAYYGWIRQQVRQNTPWDEFVRQIVTATGSTVENGAANFYALHQDPETMSENVCQAFLSLSIGCAKCHNHPLEKWTNDQYYAMASLFARVRGKGWGGDARGGDGVRTVVLATDGELIQPLRGKPQPPTPLDAEPLAPDAPGDRRAYLADWLTAPENPYFTRAIVNRVWHNFFGVGLVNPVDDLRTSNPATNEPLFEALCQYLIDQDFDLKALMRQILQSETYQRTSRPLETNREENRFFSRYYPRRLQAEVLLDAIAQVTGVPSTFTQIGYDGNDVEKTDAYPVGTRALELADSAVVSDFLKTFGRNDRDITCECGRSNTPSLVQVLHINNGETINERLQAPESCVATALARLDEENRVAVVEQAFLRCLSRPPTEHEQAGLLTELAEVPPDGRRAFLEDLYWSLMSSREFLFHH